MFKALPGEDVDGAEVAALRARVAELEAENAKLRQADRRSLLLEVTRAVLENGRDEASLTALVFEMVAPHLDADICFNYRLDEEGGVLRLVMGPGIPPEFLQASQTLQLGQAFCGTVAATCAPLAADAARIALDENGAFARGMGVRAYACHPLVGSDGRLLGTLSLASTRRDRFSDEEVEFLQTLCHFVALAWERQRAEAALRQSEERLRRVQRIGRVGGFEVNFLTGETFRSAESMEVQGHPPVPVKETYADWVRRLHPDDRERIERRFRDAVADGAPDAEYAQDYRILTPDGETRWIAARGEIERDPHGRALRMVGAHVDVTDLKLAEAALRESEERLRLALEAARLTTWEYDVRRDLGSRGGALSVRFPGLPDSGFGVSDWFVAVHPDDRARVENAFRAAAAGISPRYVERFRLRRLDGTGWRWIETLGAPVEREDATGKPLRLAGVSQDVTEQVLAEERGALLTRELNHRAMNALAVVQAALRLTPRDDPETFARAVEGRVNALARAHALLASAQWSGAGLRALASGELTPFLPGAGVPEDAPVPRAELRGPDVTLSPAAAQALSLALHELATNATKHGALSAPGGRVGVSWAVDSDAAALRLRWAETGGPRVEAPPTRRGFGSRVIEATLRDQLGGRVERSWEASGLVCEVELPLARALAGET